MDIEDDEGDVDAYTLFTIYTCMHIRMVNKSIQVHVIFLYVFIDMDGKNSATGILSMGNKNGQTIERTVMHCK